MPPVICPSCHSSVPVGAIFCDNCGYDLRTITAVNLEPIYSSGTSSGAEEGDLVCTNCGYNNVAGSRFCENCGTQLFEKPAQVQQTPAAPTPVAPAVPSIQPSEPSATPDLLTGQASSREDSPRVSEPTSGKLIVSGKNITIPLPAGNQTLIIGREDPVSGIFPDIDLEPLGGHEAGVGRKHAQLNLQNGEVFIEDLESVNGTAINKHKLPPHTPQKILNGDELRLGKLVLIYIET